MLRGIISSLLLLITFAVGLIVLFSMFTPFWAIIAIIAFIVTK